MRSGLIPVCAHYYRNDGHFLSHLFLIHATRMAESKPLTKLIRASIEFTMDAGTSAAAITVPGIIIATPKLDSDPIKKLETFFIIIFHFVSTRLLPFFQTIN
mgnify:CR=1 FL=1